MLDTVESGTQIDQDLAEIRASARNIVSTLESEVVRNRYVINALANVLDDGLILLDSSGTVTVMNSVAGTLLGLQSSDCIGSSISEVVPDMDIVEYKGIQHKEVVVVDKITGLPRYLELLSSKIDGIKLELKVESTPAFLVTVRDITYKKAREYRVSDLTSFHSNLISSLPIPTFYTDPDGGTIRGSQTFFELTGLSKLGALSKNIKEVLPKYVVQRFLSASDSQYVTYCDIQTVEGEKHLLLYRSLLKSHEEKVIGVIGCLVDANHFSIDPLSEILVKALSNYSEPLAILSYHSGKPFMVNQAFTKEFGYTSGDLSQGFHMIAPHESEVELRKSLIRSKVSKRSIITKPVRLVHKDGASSIMQVRIVPVTRSFSSSAGYFMLLRD